jgi:hypothetical protein
MTAECTISFEDLSGEIDLTERGERSADGFYPNNNRLIEKTVDDFELTIIVDDEHNVKIHHRVFHVENDDTKRAFHAVLTTTLEWDTVRQLRDFFDMILKWQQQLQEK